MAGGRAGAGAGAAGRAVVAAPLDGGAAAGLAAGLPNCHCIFLLGEFLVNAFVSGFDQI